ncbi:MAG TPA: hypothetical protein PLF79_16455 [Thauera sp.]|uniref:hypothetical protein n=1 Tax=Thauera sp. TaxID=1905334 RepID=UPI002B7CD442|nr:hypothetical protein [Thauera sp.]HRP24493.1 hypothetical protein [Thauera sp.]HRP67668.1 hypothetical protein [Thauera sp.]
MTPETVATLIAEIEAEDPLDFAGLALDAGGARLLMAAHFCDIDRKLVELGLAPDQRLEMMAAIAAHSMVENMLLHLSRLRRDSEGAEFRAWMRRHGIGGAGA